MQAASMVDNSHRKPLAALRRIVDVECGHGSICDLIVDQTLPESVEEILTHVVCFSLLEPDQHVYDEVFSPLFLGLYRTMQAGSMVGNSHRKPLAALRLLMDVDVECGRGCCHLMVDQAQFLPESLTGVTGWEISQRSFLGPFLNISVCEDDPKVADEFFNGEKCHWCSSRLQDELQCSRAVKRSAIDLRRCCCKGNCTRLCCCIKSNRSCSSRCKCKKKYAKTRCEGFILFVMYIINNSKFLLAESITILKRIHLEFDDIDNLKERLISHQVDVEKCRSGLLHATETLDLLGSLTTVRGPFQRPELVGQLSAMLNFNLQQLCGHNCKNLKVQAWEKYGFKPRMLLKQLVDIYVNLFCGPFTAAIDADEIFKKKLFARAPPTSELQQFCDLASRAIDVYINMKGEDDISDAPEEFRDKFGQDPDSGARREGQEDDVDSENHNGSVRGYQQQF